MCNEVDSTQLCPIKEVEVELEVERKLMGEPDCHIFVDDKFLWTPRGTAQQMLWRLAADKNAAGEDAHCLSQSPYTHNMARRCSRKPWHPPAHLDRYNTQCRNRDATRTRIDECAFFWEGPDFEFRPLRDGA